MMKRLVLACALAFCALFVACPAAAQTSDEASDRAAPQHVAPDDVAPKNVILVIPDGFGPASATMARDYLRTQQGIESLAYDSLQRGAVRTFAADSRVTDSAAGATAYSSGTKTNNGYVGVDTLKRPVATLLEAAEQRGMATGLVVTSRITHATPASFSAHVPERWLENEIAAQQIDQQIDLILGGGRRHFLPEPQGGRREDGRNLVAEAREKGYTIVEDRTAFDAATSTPLLGLFSMSHMDYELDRDSTQQPSLAEMATKAIDLLSQDEDGYFLMLEGSRIDHAGHSNDAAAHLHDILAYNDAVAAVLEAARKDGNTLVVAVSDHETGGMSLGRDVNSEGLYAWHPDVIAGVESSHEPMIEALQHIATPASDSQQVAANANSERASASDSTTNGRAPARADQPETRATKIRGVIATMAGIDDLAASEVARIERNLQKPKNLNFALSEIIGKRAVIGWTTRGHTAVDVNLYAYGPGADRFMGNLDNTEVGRRLAELLNFDLEALTKSMREEMAATEAPSSGTPE